jgi:hypothetical protein
LPLLEAAITVWANSLAFTVDLPLINRSFQLDTTQLAVPRSRVHNKTGDSQHEERESKEWVILEEPDRKTNHD